jgi:hypothetical protein
MKKPQTTRKNAMDIIYDPLAREIVIEGARKVFFRAMLAGYAGGSQSSVKTTTADGYTAIEFADGDFRMVDRYCVNPHSDHSAGTTTIFLGNLPIWWMAYGGSYQAEAIPFLKEVLASAYRDSNFCGGRGFAHGIDNKAFSYNNIWTGDFCQFDGLERIFNLEDMDKEVGSHEYFGMILI